MDSREQLFCLTLQRTMNSRSREQLFCPSNSILNRNDANLSPPNESSAPLSTCGSSPALRGWSWSSEAELRGNSKNTLLVEYDKRSIRLEASNKYTVRKNRSENLDMNVTTTCRSNMYRHFHWTDRIGSAIVQYTQTYKRKKNDHRLRSTFYPRPPELSSMKRDLNIFRLAWKYLRIPSSLLSRWCIGKSYTTP